MSRTLPNNFGIAVEQTVTTPIYLFQAVGHFAASSFDKEVSAVGVVWAPANMTIVGPEQRSGGTLDAQVSLPYTFPGLMDKVLNNRFTDVPVKLYMTYFLQSVYAEPVLLMDGYISDFYLSQASADGVPRVIFSITTASARGGITPNIRIGPPLLNHITPKGTIIQWNGQTVGIDR